MTTLEQQLKFDEGLRLEKYKCTAGRWTIGYGHNLDAHPNWPKGEKIADTITEEEAEHLLAYDIGNTIISLWGRWPEIISLDKARRDACINMAFQLGINGFLRFRKMKKALMNKDWELAHKEALDSNWSKQTPARARRVASQLLTGQYYAIPSDS